MSRKLSAVSQSDRERVTKNLRLLFETYRGSDPGVDNKALLHFVSECELLDRALTTEAVDLIFSRVKVGRKNELNLNRFEEACRQIANLRGVTYTDLIMNCSRIKGIGEGAAAGKQVDPSTLSIREIKRILTEKGIDFSACVEKSEMVALLVRSGTQAKVTGLAALRHSATEMLATVEESEYEVQYHTKRSLGISIERANEWGVVKVAPSEVEVGSVLTRVNGKSVLLESYQQAMLELKHAKWPLRMRFRRSPTKTGTLWKRSRGRTGATRNWKRRFVVLTSGILEYFTREPEKGGELKGQYVLENDPGSQTMVTMAPEAIMGSDEHGIMIVKGDDRLVLKADSYADLVDWGAKLYYAVAMANGGNPEMRQHELARLAVEQSHADAARRQEEAQKHIAEAQASLAAHHAAEDRRADEQHAAAEAAAAAEAEAAAAAKAEADAAAAQAQAEADERDRAAALEAERKQAEEAEAVAAAKAEAEALAQDATDGVQSLTVEQVGGDADDGAAGGADGGGDKDEDEDEDEEGDNVPAQVAIAVAAVPAADAAKQAAVVAARVSLPAAKLQAAAAAAEAAEAEMEAAKAEAEGGGAAAEEAPAAAKSAASGEFEYQTDDSWFSM